jgi:hypothetical protein
MLSKAKFIVHKRFVITNFDSRDSDEEFTSGNSVKSLCLKNRFKGQAIFNMKL